MIAELDKERNLAFGYANLNDDVYAKWGYISMKELIDNGATKDIEWTRLPFNDALKKVKQYR